MATALALLLGPASACFAAAATPTGPAGRPGTTAGENPAEKYLDLPLSNADGEQPGGVHPDLPVDAVALEGALDAARAHHVEPRRYAALLWQYWLVRTVDDAGIGLSAWAPLQGVEPNEATVLAVYTYYGTFFLDHPDLQWAGMADMVGPSLAAGFSDLGLLGDLADPLHSSLVSLSPRERAALPPVVQTIADGGLDEVTPDEQRWFESRLLAMQKHVFMDQGAMHTAYLAGGLGSIEEMHSAGLIDAAAVTAWRSIDSGDPQAVRDGNTQLLSREQNQILAPQWDEMRAHDGPVGEMVTYAMTVVGSVTIPGARTPAGYLPLTVGGPADADAPGFRLVTPLPGFNLADNEARWDYITHDTLPAYQRLLTAAPGEVRRIVAGPMDERVAGERLARRWPEVAAGLLTGWRPEIQVLRTGRPQPAAQEDRQAA